MMILHHFTVFANDKLGFTLNVTVNGNAVVFTR